jgi:DNA-binding SARP family transcriptional activator/tetratricopeptide (TPR) repeat protein
MDELRVRLLGPFEVEGIPASAIGSRKTRRFLKLLAVAAGRPVSVDRAVDVLWDGHPPAKPADQLSVLASRLRSSIGSDRVVRSDGGYALRVDWLDRVELEQLAADAADRLAAGRVAAAGAAARAALHLVRGELLADEVEGAWIEAERAAVDRLVRGVVAIAGEIELAGGDPIAAAALAERALASDGYDERALRLLMTAHRRAGRPASALAAYARLRTLLSEELGVSPSPETEALHEAILLGRDDRSVGAGSRDPGGPGDGADGQEVGGADRLVADLATDRLDDGPPAARVAAPPIVGRREEREHLDAALASAITGHTRVVVIDGEAGIGKSALLRSWCDAIASGVTVLRATCDELGRQLPLQAVGDALAAHVRGLEPEVTIELLGDDAPLLRPLLAVVPDGPAVSSTAAGAAEISPGQGALFAALVGVFNRLAASRPVVLALDDGHHADAATLGWIRYAQRRDAAGSLLVVMAARDDDPALLEADERVRVDVLSRRDVVDLVATMNPASPADPATAERIDQLLVRSGGHPLFLVELASAPAGELPASIRAAVAARRDEMGAAGTTIEAAAVLGTDVDLDLLTAVLRRPPLEVLADLEAGARGRVLDERGSGFAFHHALVRDALVSSISASRRSLLHREAARHLAEHRVGDGDPLRVAHHARLGNEPHLASAALTAAARNASARFDYAEAQVLLDEALDLADVADARHARGLVWLAVGRLREAAEDAAVALRLGGGAAALELAGWVAYYERDFEAARRFAEEGARRADDPAIEAGCLLVAGRVRHADGDLAGADDCLTAAVSRSGGALPVAPVWLGALRVHQSRPGDALDLVAPMLLDPRADHPFAATHAGLTAGYAHALLGHGALALAALDEAEAAMRERGHGERFAGRVQNWRGWMLRYLGAGTEAEESNHAGLEAADASQLVEPRAHALLDLADAALLRGDAADAGRWLALADPLHDGVHAMRWRHALRGRLLLARVALLEERADDARTHTAWVRRDAVDRGVERYAVFADLVDAIAALHTDPAEEGPDPILPIDPLGPIDPLDPAARTDRALERLPVVAGIEAWWWTNTLAAAAATAAARGRTPSVTERHRSAAERWQRLADQRAAFLIDNAGARGDGARAWIASAVAR